MRESFIEYFPQKVEREKLERLYEEIFEKGNTNWEEIIQAENPHKVEQYIATYLYDWITYELESAMLNGDYFVIFKTFQMLKKGGCP